MSKHPKRVEPGVVLAISWALAAIALTLLLGGRLGLRGWIWLSLHHFFCVIGVSHELRSAWLRRKEIEHV
jgi:hypothetical protein